MVFTPYQGVLGFNTKLTAPEGEPVAQRTIGSYPPRPYPTSTTRALVEQGGAMVRVLDGLVDQGDVLLQG